MKTKKILIALFFILSLINLASPDFHSPLAYASSVAAPSQNTLDKFKADFSYEMAQLTAKIVSAPNNNVIRFKVLIDNEIDQTIAAVSPKLPEGLKAEFGAEMTQIKNKIYGNPKLNVEKAKADFSYDIAQLTTRIMTKVEQQRGGGASSALPAKAAYTPSTSALISPPKQQQTPQQQQQQPVNYGTTKRPVSILKPLTPESYTKIMDDLMNVGDQKNTPYRKIKVEGSIRYHYAINPGSASWSKNTSGVRADVGFVTKVAPNWQIRGSVTGKNSFLNYEDTVTFKLSAAGKMGNALLQAGAFYYPMAEGNIYDSTFTGGKIDFGGPIQYSFSFGNTDNSVQTFIASARYEALDYNLEGSVYNYRPNDSTGDKNIIVALGGNYKFSNFSTGAMFLAARNRDTQGNRLGYVLNINYGEVKTYKPGALNIWAKYYNQPRHTYLSPSMNGRGGWMEGYKGYGLGIKYTLAENLVAGLEYYSLSELTSGAMGQTWWADVTYYF